MTGYSRFIVFRKWVDVANRNTAVGFAFKNIARLVSVDLIKIKSY